MNLTRRVFRLPSFETAHRSLRRSHRREHFFLVGEGRLGEVLQGENCRLTQSTLGAPRLSFSINLDLTTLPFRPPSSPRKLRGHGRRSYSP